MQLQPTSEIFLFLLFLWQQNVGSSGVFKIHSGSGERIYAYCRHSRMYGKIMIVNVREK